MNFEDVQHPNLSRSQERVFNIPQEHNVLTVQLNGHSYISVSRNGKKVIGSKSTCPVFSFALPPETYTIHTDGEIVHVTSEAVKLPLSLLEQIQEPTFFLRITSDAPDHHIVDGIGEIIADGSAFCTIEVNKVSFAGTPLTGDDHQDELFIRTTGGKVMDEAGDNRIRSLRLRSGQARFRLVSEPNPKVVTVSVFGHKPQQLKADIQIEFI